MDLISHVTLLGGACSRAELIERCGRAAVERALVAGHLESVARGRYALPSATSAARAATTWGGVVSMRSAAQRLGWGQKEVPILPDVTFPRNRHLAPSARRVLVPHWSDVDTRDVDAGATGVRRTLVDCMRMLSLVEALPIVDSAVRSDDVTSKQLQVIAEQMRGRGRSRARAIAAMASARAANPYESTLRAIAAAVPGLDCVPQYAIRVSPRRVLHPDLADPARRLVIEAESFEWHGKTAALTRDCARYNAFVLLGWTVLRFSWYQVMRQPGYVVDVLTDAVRDLRRHANVVPVREGRQLWPAGDIRMSGYE